MREQHLPKIADPLPGSELVGWANTIRRLQPARDPAEFDRTKKGQYLIAGKGNALSRWAQSVEGSGRGSDAGLILVSDDDVRLMVEQFGSEADYLSNFGEPEEG